MTRGFTDVLAFVLAREGGFVNDPRDPGGMTNLGVTARQWQAWTGHGVNEAVMRSLTPAAVGNFYRSGYWHAIAGEELPIALALAVFDFAVNAGPSRAVFELQELVGAHADGKAGPATLRAVQAYAAGIGLARLIDRYCDARADFYRTLERFPIYGKGWLARIELVRREAKAWLG